MIEIGEIETTNAPHPTEPPALLVVQSSSRGWLLATLPPSLILLGGLAITSHQFRPDPASYAPLQPDLPATSPILLTQAPVVAPGDFSVRAESSPTAARDDLLPDAPAPPDSTPIPAVLDPAPSQEIKKPEPPAAPLVETAEIESEVSPPIDPPAPVEAPSETSPAQVVWDDIDTEAREAKQRREEAEQLRGEAFARTEQAASERLTRARMAAANDRGQFLSDLSTLVRRHGRKAGPYISELTGLYGRDMPPELRKLAESARGKLDAANAPAQTRVALYRQLGISEACILDELSNQYTQAIGSRKGPRNRQEVLYFAARLLVSVPLESTSPPPVGALKP